MVGYSFHFKLVGSFTSFLFLIAVENSMLVESSSKSKRPTGPSINATKNLSFPDFSPGNPRIYDDVKLLGSAIFSNEEHCIQIPDVSHKGDLRHLAGRALHSSTIRIFDPVTQTPASFETTFSFQFKSTTNTTSDSGRSEGGSGLTFFIVPDEFTVGRAGPWLGMLNDVCDDDYKAVGIEFDTHQNPEFGDPNDNHVGINLASIVSIKTINASEVGVYLKDGSVHRAWIKYDGRRRFLEVLLGRDSHTYPSKPVFSGPLNLGPFLKEYMFVGFSASTGNFTQIHKILSWNFTSTSQAVLRVPTTDTCESKIVLESEIAHRKTTASFLVFLAVAVLVLVVLLNLYSSSKRRKEENSDGAAVVLPEKMHRPRPPNKPHRFTLAEIQSATRCFGELQELGSDARSVTYKGMTSKGCVVAVKRFSTQFLNLKGLDRRRMAKEIKAISNIRHPNLVPVRGWCYDNRETLVVYDYVQNGSLDKWLFGVGVLPWTRRFKVVRDVAEALSYLHTGQLAHKNVKTTSVFLDVSFRAVLGDFGFVLNSSESRRFKSVVSQKADVYDFGILALEVVAGRKRRKRSDPGQMELLDLAWARHESDEKANVVDRRMGTVVNTDQAVRVLEIGLLCTLNENKGRPTMEKVVECLSSEVAIPELPPSRPVALFPYSSSSGLCNGFACFPFK